MDPYSNRCPSCDAAADHYCITRTGRKSSKPHAARSNPARANPTSHGDKVMGPDGKVHVIAPWSPPYTGTLVYCDAQVGPDGEARYLRAKQARHAMRYCQVCAQADREERSNGFFTYTIGSEQDPMTSSSAASQPKKPKKPKRAATAAPAPMQSSDEFDTVEGLQAWADAHRDDSALQDSMVYLLFDDGELTATKGGNLLWQRNMHLMSHPIPGVHLELPHTYGKHKFAPIRFPTGHSTKFEQSLQALRLKLTGSRYNPFPPPPPPYY